MKWCADPTLVILNPAPTTTFSHEPGYHTNTVVQTATFTISPTSTCWYPDTAVILDSSNTDQSALFIIDYSTLLMDLVGDVLLAGQTISYNLFVNILDADTSIIHSS